MTSTTVQLYPISQVWRLISKTCSTKPGVNDKKIYFHPPVGLGQSCNAEWVTDRYKIELENPSLTVVLGGSYGGWHYSGGIKFEIHGFVNGADQVIWSRLLGSLSPTPMSYNIGKINTDDIYFKVVAYDLTCMGCAPWIEPVSFTVSGTLPPSQANVNVEVKIVEASNPSIPIQDAEVMLTCSSYGYSEKARTNSYGIASFSNVPFNPYASYDIVVSKGGYKTSGISITGSELEQKDFTVEIMLTKLAVGFYGYVKDILTTVGVVVGVGIAGYAIYKYDLYRKAYSGAMGAYRQVTEHIRHASERIRPRRE